MIRLIIRYLPSVVIPTLISLIITFIFGNYLAPDYYGKYSLLVTTVSIINAFLFSFIISSVLRLYNEYRKENKQDILISTYISTIVFIATMLGLILSFLLGMNGFYISLCVLGFVFFSFSTNYLRAIDKPLMFNVLKILVPSLNLLIIVLVLYYSTLNHYWGAVGRYAPMIIIALCLITIYFASKKGNRRFDLSLLKQTFNFGYPLAIVGMTEMVISSSDRYMLAYMVNITEVGIYSFAYKIAEISIITLTMVIITALYPQLIKKNDDKGKSAAEDLLNRYINFHFILVIPLVFLLINFSGDIIPVLFSRYTESVALVKYLSVGIFIYSITFYINKAFELTKNTFMMIKILMITALINLLLNFILIPRLFTLGAVIATLISYLFYVIYTLRVTKGFFNININYSKLLLIIIINILCSFLNNMLPDLRLGTIIQLSFEATVYIINYLILIYFGYKLFNSKKASQDL